MNKINNFVKYANEKVYQIDDEFKRKLKEAVPATNREPLIKDPLKANLAALGITIPLTAGAGYGFTKLWDRYRPYEPLDTQPTSTHTVKDIRQAVAPHPQAADDTVDDTLDDIASRAFFADTVINNLDGWPE